MSTKSESSEFIGWYSRHDEVEGLKARNAQLVAALEEIAFIKLEDMYVADHPNDNLAAMIAREALQQSTEKP